MLALRVDGGFRTDDQKYDVVKDHRLVVIKEAGTEGVSVKYPDDVSGGSVVMEQAVVSRGAL